MNYLVDKERILSLVNKIIENINKEDIKVGLSKKTKTFFVHCTPNSKYFYSIKSSKNRDVMGIDGVDTYSLKIRLREPHCLVEFNGLAEQMLDNKDTKIIYNLLEDKVKE